MCSENDDDEDTHVSTFPDPTTKWPPTLQRTGWGKSGSATHASRRFFWEPQIGLRFAASVGAATAVSYVRLGTRRTRRIIPRNAPNPGNMRLLLVNRRQTSRKLIGVSDHQPGAGVGLPRPLARFAAYQVVLPLLPVWIESERTSVRAVKASKHTWPVQAP